MNDSLAPKLSIIVIVYRMARQAQNTLFSLSANYQKNVNTGDYEVIVIENESDEMLDENSVRALGNNFHYHRHHSDNSSPVSAINLGFKLAKGNFIGLIIDGARILTPRVLEYALMAARLPSNPLVATATFNLGPYLHYSAETAQFDVDAEQAMLASTHWQTNGYRLFDIANVGEANPVGYYQPMLESNCFFTTRANFAAIGYADEDFSLPGGGGINLHLFRAIGMLEQCEQYFVLAGEGSFHQQHGGVTTSPAQTQQRAALLEQFRLQLAEKWQGKCSALEREPIILGSITQPATEFAAFSSARGFKRLQRLYERGCYFYQDDFHRPRFSYQRRDDSFNKPEPR